MNDTERDLRELFESKARDAGGAPPVTREVLRRGRRRQAGTVAVAGLTALAVAAVAVVSLQTLHRSDTTGVPGGSTGNPAFTATIQNFTLAVPDGWTLIDEWPLGANMAVGVGSSSFSCTGQAVDVSGGGGKASANGTSSSSGSTTDCADLSTPTPPTIPHGELPVLALSNADPGLFGSVCNAGGSLPATSATLYIGLDVGVTQTAGWERTVRAWPDPLGNVLPNDLPPDQMPCGPGGYAHFQTGGVPYIAWAGFGSDLSDADTQAIVDLFNGMQVSDAAMTPPTTDLPGYVLTGGSTGGQRWTLEVAPSRRNVAMTLQTIGGTASGFGDFDVPSRPIDGGTIDGISFGAVTFDAERVEARPDDGSGPVQASILHLPDSLGAPFDAFVVERGTGQLVAVGPDGDLGSTPTTPNVRPGPTAEDRAVQSDLRDADVAAKTYYVDGTTFWGFDPSAAASIEPSLTYNTAAHAVVGEVSIRDVGADHIVLTEATEAGTVFCIAETTAGLTTYGAVDAQRFEGCIGGEAAWGMDATASAPPPVPVESSGSASPLVPVESSVELTGFGVPATLTVRRETEKGCLSIGIQIGDAGSGACGAGPFHPNTPFITMQSVRVGGAVAMVFGYVPAEAARVFLVSDSGRRFDATLFTLEVEPRVRFFAFAVAVTSGRLHIQDGQGAELSQPLQLTAEP